MKLDALPWGSVEFLLGMIILGGWLKPFLQAGAARLFKREVEDPQAASKVRGDDHEKRIISLENGQQLTTFKLNGITETVNALKMESHEQTKEARKVADSQLKSETLLGNMLKEQERQARVQEEILRRLPPSAP